MHPQSALSSEITACLPAINQALDFATRGANLPANLGEAVRYAVLGGGKRIRPMLCWHACRAVSGRGEPSLPAGVSIELIHAFSLVHDDLPAMDDDELRRGRPSLHVHTSEAMAILAGDTMLTLAFALVQENCPPGLAANLTREIGEGTRAMIAGQVYDTLGGLEDLDPVARLQAIHQNKTGGLIRCACRMGAWCGIEAGVAADAAAVEILGTFGDRIGLMFQIVDDLLDVEQSSEHIGKRSGKDDEAGKLTYPGVLGVAGSRDEVRRLEEEAVTMLEPFGQEADALIEICRYLAVRTR